MAKTGGAFLLQELEPKRLLGSMMSVADEGGWGWIYLSFFPDPAQLTLEERGPQTSFVISRAVAANLIGLLQVMVVQNRILRHEEVVRSRSSSRKRANSGLSVKSPHRNLFTCSWASGMTGARHRNVEGQIELRLREDVAEEMSLRLIEEMARIAAHSSRA